MTALEFLQSDHLQKVSNKSTGFDVGTDQPILGVQEGCCVMSDQFTLPLESATRKKIDLILTNLGWNTDEFSANCNVFTERAKTVEQQELLKQISGYRKPPDYVLYESGTDKPIGIIEAKRPSQSLEQALKQAIKNYAVPLNVNVIFVTDGALIETFDRRTDDNLYLDDQLITEFLSEKILKKFIEQGSKVYSSQKATHTKQQLIEIFADANDILREEGMREGLERFTEFSNLLFLKLISEIEDDREKNGEDRKLEKKYCWESFSNKEPELMLDYINKIVLPRLVDRYNDSGEVFQKELGIKKPDILERIVKKLSSLNLLDTDSDVKGDAFEYFLKNSVTVGRDLGEYFTPRHIVKLMVDLVQPTFEEKVYDPACGTGGFLIEAFKHVRSKCKQTKENIDILENHTVYGRELTGTAKIAKMNMIIMGDGHTNIKQMDSLEFPVKEEYDVILTNFPFSQKTRYGSSYGFNTKSANPVFLKHVLDGLTTTGRGGVIVPDGLLFGTDTELVKLRTLLLETCNVIAVIQLHTFVFTPYTKQPTCIVIFEKGKQTKKVWFFEVEEDGFEKTASMKGRPPIQKNDLKLLRELWIDKSNSSHSFSVNFETIKTNSYKLTMNTYKPKIPWSVPTVPLKELCDPIIGGTPPTRDPECWDGSNSWVTITDMKQKSITETENTITDKGVEVSNVKKIEKGTLLFSFKLTIGRVAFAGKDLYTNEAIAALIPLDKSDKLLSQYLYHILPRLYYVPYAQRATKGYTLNSDSIGEVEIPYPDPDIRKKLIEDMEQQEKEKERLVLEIKRIKEKQFQIVKQYTT